jgi:hypothetical protein
MLNPRDKCLARSANGCRTFAKNRIVEGRGQREEGSGQKKRRARGATAGWHCVFGWHWRLARQCFRAARRHWQTSCKCHPSRREGEAPAEPSSALRLLRQERLGGSLALPARVFSSALSPLPSSLSEPDSSPQRTHHSLFRSTVPAPNRRALRRMPGACRPLRLEPC